MWKGITLGISCSLIWGLQAVVSRDGIIHGLTASDVTAIRFFTSGLILLPNAISRRPAIVGPLPWFRAGILTLLVGAPYR